MAEGGEERDQAPTGKRLSEARSKGNVAKSQELNMALGLLFSFFCLKMFSPNILINIGSYMERVFTSLLHRDFSQTGIAPVLMDFWVVFFSIMLPILFIIMSLNLLVSYFQTGIMFSFYPLMPKLSSLNPINGCKRFFSAQSLVELLKSILKMIIVGYIGYKFIMEVAPAILTTKVYSPQSFIFMVGGLVYKLAMKIIPTYIVLAIADYVYKRYEHYKGLKMTRQEVKEEGKQAENPTIKGMVRKRRMELFRKLSLKQVPTASVVVTNPDHYAIGIKYDESMEVPMVVAKGMNLIAEKIKEIARKHKIPIFENKPLARSLYSDVEVNHPIPPDLYLAVAKVIVHISRLKGGKGVKIK